MGWKLSVSVDGEVFELTRFTHVSTWIFEDSWCDKCKQVISSKSEKEEYEPTCAVAGTEDRAFVFHERCFEKMQLEGEQK